MRKKERIEVSIIIPLYNAEKYIAQCIESVQQFYQFLKGRGEN